MDIRSGVCRFVVYAPQESAYFITAAGMSLREWHVGRAG
jgi:hypothetical protein